MALQLGSFCEALIEAGSKPETAAKASEEVALYDTRLSSVDSRLSLLSWMVGANLALTVAVLGRLLVVH
jgi:hypothetical protein